MAVLSVDLACRRWQDLGLAILERVAVSPDISRLPEFLPGRRQWAQPAENRVVCELVSWSEAGLEEAAVEPEILAGRLNHLANLRGIRMILLDGPQAWKSTSNGLEFSRVSERQLNTAAKTGLPGMVKPLSYRHFTEFCMDVYDGLARRGWRRLETREQPGAPSERVLVESYPQAAWKSLGIKPLTTKRKARLIDLAESFAALKSVIPIEVNRPPNHDQLQAIVGGLAGLALEERETAGARILGTAPRREEGQWREGFIVLPTPPIKMAGVRWLH